MHKQQIHDLIEKALRYLGIQEMPSFNVSYPPEEKFGDYTTNAAMVAAKIFKKEPLAIAKEIESSFDKLRMTSRENLFEKIEVVPPGFINFYLKPEIIRKNLANILKQKEKFGSTSLTASGRPVKIGKGKTVVIDYSAPNIAKLMHVGHLRSTIIGQAIYNIYKFLGYKTVGDNHIGDWGTHFGKLIYAYNNFVYPERSRGADKKKLKENFIAEMNRLYVDFNNRVKTDPDLEQFARAETKKFQDGDKENVKIWKYFVRESMKEFNRVYKTLGVKIDYTLGESFYQKMLGEIISEALGKSVAKYSEGAVIIPLEKYNLPPLMIQKSDGATLYGTTDLATIKYRLKRWRPEKIIYVVANEQAGHLAQLFRAAELLGYLKEGEAIHVKFGMVLGPDGKKLSTREGKVVLLEDLLKEAISRAYKIVSKKNPKLLEKEKKAVAKAVGIGAIKYNDLSQNRLTDITFNWDKMLDFRGNSAPYLQYTYARIKSILRGSTWFNKAHHESLATGAKTPGKFNPELLRDEKELAILRQLVFFDEIAERAAGEFAPNIIADYLYKLANGFNAFYEILPVLGAEKDLRQARLALISAAAITLKNGLKLLGIETLERM